MNNHTDNHTAKTNFYQYVNNKWIDQNTIPDHMIMYSSMYKLHDDCQDKQIVLGKMSKNELLRKIFHISMNRFDKTNPMTSLREITNLYENLDNTNNANNINCIGKYMAYTMRHGIDNFLDIEVCPDMINSNVNVLHVSCTSTLLPERKYYFDDEYLETREKFRQHISNVKDIALDYCPELSEYINNEFVINVFNFETNIGYLSMTGEQSSKYSETFTSTTIDVMINNINDLNSVNTKKTNYSDNELYQIDNNDVINNIKTFFAELFGLSGIIDTLEFNSNANPELFEDYESNKIVVWDGDGFRRILSLVLNEENFDSYRSWLTYKILLRSIVTQDMDDEMFDFYSKHLSGTKSKKSLEKRTIEYINNNVPDIMAKTYVENYFPEEYKKDIENMICNSLKTLQTSIESNDFFTQQTTERALEKLSKFNYKIGYPNKFKEYTITLDNDDDMYIMDRKIDEWTYENVFLKKINTAKDPDEWMMSPQTVNAYYDATCNEIVFPAAFLQNPLYIYDVNDLLNDEYFDVYQDCSELGIDNDTVNIDHVKYAYNCGSIMFVINHEITHGFDSEGRKFDSNGNNNDWWTEEDSEKYDSIVSVLKHQTDAYKFTIDDVTYVNNYELTLGENIADIGGITIAMKSLKNYLESNGVDESHYKFYYRIFFRAAAVVWRSITRDSERIRRINTDYHSPPDFRANLVNNLEEFYYAYDVVESDDMWLDPEYRLKLW